MSEMEVGDERRIYARKLGQAAEQLRVHSDRETLLDLLARCGGYLERIRALLDPPEAQAKAIDPELRPAAELPMRAIADSIKEILPETMGFTLLVFDYGGQGFMNYVSTAQREDMIASLRELIALLEGSAMEQPGGVQ